MRVVPVPVPVPGPPPEELPGMEDAAEGDVGESQEGNGQVEEPVENPGPLRGPALQPGDPRFPSLDAGWAESAKAGRGREDAQSEASEWELREREERDEERRLRDAAMGEEAERLLFFPLPFLSASTGNEDMGDET